MAVSLYFGLPGCGKTTLLASMALKASCCRRYKYVYSNVYLTIPGVTYIPNDVIGKYNLRDCLILIDEGTLFADSRHHRDFPQHVCEFFMLHRHYNCDIIIFTQGWDTLDKRIRQITDRVFYVYKTRLWGLLFTRYYRIPYGIIIPDPKKDSGSTKLGEIIQGYCKPPLLIRIFAHRLFRPKYYGYFNSWDKPELPPLPDRYKPYIKKSESAYKKTMAHADLDDDSSEKELPSGNSH